MTQNDDVHHAWTSESKVITQSLLEAAAYQIVWAYLKRRLLNNTPV